MKFPSGLVLLCLILCLGQSLQAAVPDQTAANEHTELERTPPPISPKEMLEKFKLGLAQNSFLNGEFYTEQNLAVFFGAPYLIKFLNVPEALNVRVYSIDLPPAQDADQKPSVENQNDETPLFKGGKIYLSAASNNQLTIHYVINTNVPGISANLVRDIFGTPTSITGVKALKKDDGENNMTEKIIPPLGNSSLNYQTQAGEIFETVLFTTNADAQVIEIQVYTGRKQ